MRFPNKQPAPTIATPRKAIAQTPSADASFSPLPRALKSEYRRGDWIIGLLGGQNQRIGHFEHREGKRQDTASDDIGRDQGKRDLPQRAQRTGSQTLSRLFQIHAGLLKPGRRRPDHVRQASHCVGDDQQNDGILSQPQKSKRRPSRVIARYPKASTIPGTARGNMARPSRSCRPGTVVLTTR